MKSDRFGFVKLASMPGMKRVPLFKSHGREATIVVAAWNSKNFKRADYIAPKEDALDFITQIIIPKLPSDGGSITLLEGSFEGSSTDKPLEIISKANIKIQGQGRGTKLHLGTGISSNLIEVIGSNGILIENMYLDGDTSATKATSNYKQNGILFNVDVEYSKIRNVWVANCNRRGVLTYSSQRNEIMGCTFLSNGDDGIYLLRSSNNTLSGNTLNENGGNGISTHDATGNTITGNTCEKNDLAGISVSDSSKTTISGNTCNDNLRHGIAIAAFSDENTTTSNTCSGNSRAGIYIYFGERGTVNSNSCSENDREGILLFDSSYNNVVGNTCQKNGKDGILLDRDCIYNGILANVVIDNGKSAAVGSVVYDGISITDGCDYNNIQENTVRKDGVDRTHKYGIHIEDSNCDANLVTNNDLYASGVTADFNDNGTGTITVPGNRT